ncbi:MAG TPA: Arc family DNA-binding protein [Candidatus Sulfomarinibacteraceae bacterium]|nr:Arc family DNA-binding protein [Candidatus Sulfomarinibacteraceae bacterium]
MATITVKNIPDDLYEKLKEQAAANHRSINSEIIACIENAVRSRRRDPEEILASARALRERLGDFQVTEEEITRAKREGRP